MVKFLNPDALVSTANTIKNDIWKVLKKSVKKGRFYFK